MAAPGRRPIADVAAELGLAPDATVPAGRGVLRVPLRPATERPPPRGRLVLVTAMTPTEHGEGKTVVTIGLAMALHRRGRRAVACLRQPSLGPVFGVKGGASGGGRSTVEPRPAIDLGLTGDLDAIANAQNLLVSLVDNHLFHGNALGLDAAQAVVPRVSVLEDRALRDTSSGLTVRAAGFPRPASFVIAPASEMAAIHGLADDARDLKARIDRMIVARTGDGSPVRSGALGATGAVASLLVASLDPNLVQTSEGTPALVHGIPYANVAHGTCSHRAVELALANSEYAVVEAGFSTELGAEKFVDLVQPQTGRAADAAVLVVTVRSLIWHGGGAADGADPVAAVERGFPNLEQHLANLHRIGLDPVLALNRFPGDPDAGIERVRRFARERGLPLAEVRSYAEGGDGASELAALVEAEAGRGHRSRPLYGASTPAGTILERLAREMYGGVGAELSEAARVDLARIRADGEPEGPVCVAKTPLSLGPDPTVRGRPTGFTVPVRRLVRWAGAGFTVAYAGTVVAMPGLPAHPVADRVRVDDDGRISGLL